jgi:hypothetical protein
MIGRMCFMAACAVSIAETTAAQTLSLPSIQASLERQTVLLASTRSTSSDTTNRASAQRPARSFQELQGRVNTGDTVYVIDESDRETSGQMTALSDVSLVLTFEGARREFVERAVRRIERRRRDSVRNGLLIGLGTGALVGFLGGRSADSASCPRSGIECGQGALIGVVGGAFWGAGAGWITDVLIRTREVVYLRPASEVR